MPKTIQILMPMGGLGQRFRDAGYETPKPVLEVLSVPMFQRALKSFDAYDGTKKHLFVVRQDAEDEYKLASRIKQLQPDAQIAMLQKNTRGAVETCMIAESLIDDDLPLIIMDCDFYFESKTYFDYIRELANNAAYDGVLLTFESTDPRYSFARTDDNHTVLETAEKRAISNHAIWGAYCFGSGKLYKDAARQLLQRPLSDAMKEYYTSFIYNDLIQQGKLIKQADTDHYDSFGTPEELQQFLKSQAS